MSTMKSCVVCDRPLDDDRKRRADAVTCSTRCRTALWRARRKMRRDGGSATGDAYAVQAELSAISRADGRFYDQLRRYEEATRAPSAEDIRLRDHMRRNLGVLAEPLRQRLIENTLRAQALEEAEMHDTGRIAVEDPIHFPDPTVVGRRGQASRRANRHLVGDPNAFVKNPVTGPLPGPPRYPAIAPEAEMVDAPWGRNTPRSAIGW